MSLRGAAATPNTSASGQAAQSRDARLKDLLCETLQLWRVPGTVETRDGSFIVNANGLAISIRRADEGPFRWLVTYGQRKRPSSSVLGVLNALRVALDVDRGAPHRIA